VGQIIDGDWQFVTSLSSFGLNWFEKFGDSLRAGSNSNVYEINFDGSETDTVLLPDLNGPQGVGRRSGNWWAFQPYLPNGIAMIATVDNDCDGDGILDRCAIDAGATDADGDGVPDSCQMDCDSNGIPDSAQLSLNDCNANGILDACDVNAADPDGDGVVSADCNANGVPDHCDQDCNDNQIPDDCDVDSNDPDGDGQTWDDCNADGVPDWCERRLTLVQSDELRPSGDFAGLSYGASLAADGDVVAVGAPATDLESEVVGKVFVYRKNEARWVEEAVLNPSVGYDNGNFGRLVDLDGDTLMVRALSDTGGAIVVFEFNGVSWIQTQVIELSTGLLNWFYFQLEDGRVIVTTFDPASPVIYEKHGATWTAVSTGERLPATTTNCRYHIYDDRAGAICLSGIELFRSVESNQPDVPYWVNFAGIGERRFTFGGNQRRLYFDGEIALIPQLFLNCNNFNNEQCGVVEVSRVVGNDVFFEAELSGPLGLIPNNFGAAMMHRDDRIFVAATGIGGVGGKLYCYTKEDGNWHLNQLIDAPASAAEIRWGSEMAMSNDALFVAGTNAPAPIQQILIIHFSRLTMISSRSFPSIGMLTRTVFLTAVKPIATTI